METAQEIVVERAPVGWGIWVPWVVALAAAGALSYLIGSLALFAKYTLPPVAMILFGFLAGVAQGYALRRQYPPVRWWILSSCVAGFVAAGTGFLLTGMAGTTVGMYAGWAFAWAVYGVVLGVMLQRISAGRWWMLTGLVGWGTAGIVSGAVASISDVLRVSGTTELLFLLPASLSRNWTVGGLLVAGTVCGAIGGAITGAVLVVQSQRTPSRV